MAFVNLKNVQWREREIAVGTIKVPTFMDAHGWFPTWEKERFASMQSHLKPGMVFYDIGAYDGWQDAAIAKMVGAENMVLVEPEPTNWPNIKATFAANGLGVPLATYMGFIGAGGGGDVNLKTWPQGPDYGELISHTTFRHVDENSHNTSMITLDALVMASENPPDAINVDVEGAGLLVLHSAAATLKRYHPLLWVSIHGNETFHHRPLAHFPDEHGTHEYLKQFGYKGAFLANEHEEEWFYE